MALCGGKVDTGSTVWSVLCPRVGSGLKKQPAKCVKANVGCLKKQPKFQVSVSSFPPTFLCFVSEREVMWPQGISVMDLDDTLE